VSGSVDCAAFGEIDVARRCAIIAASLLTALLAVAGTAQARSTRTGRAPIILSETGGFVIGGKVIADPRDATQHLSCDHGYVEYFLPVKPRRASLVMWHSSSTQVWQNRWDGGEGFKDMFLRRGYPVYLWDGPRVGRANWSCEPVTYTPQYRDEANFLSWNLGPAYGQWWPDVQFPVHDQQAWRDATASRYDEFDVLKNVRLQSDAAAVAADSGRLGDSIVYLTNSAGGLRAMLAASKATARNIAAIVTYESIGYVFPIGDPESPAACNDPDACGFGPVGVPLEDFKKLAKLKAIQFVWGDHRGDPGSRGYQSVEQSRLCARLINKYGGHAEVLMLGEAGLKGSTHIPFADNDNTKVAGLLDTFLRRAGLDDYRASTPSRRRRK
jgi:hypothetical protein